MSGAPDLTFGVTWPSREQFRELARDRRVIPVVRRLLADAETPLGVYRKLARDLPGTFLLESAEHGGVWSRYSIVGARSAATLTEQDGEACWIGTPPVGVPTSGDPAEALRDTVAALRTCCSWPLVSPLRQYSCRLRLQKVTRPVVSVRASASSSIQPTMST